MRATYTAQMYHQWEGEKALKVIEARKRLVPLGKV